LCSDERLQLQGISYNFFGVTKQILGYNLLLVFRSKAFQKHFDDQTKCKSDSKLHEEVQRFVELQLSE
jgi:hypothetical protein